MDIHYDLRFFLELARFEFHDAFSASSRVKRNPTP